MRDLQRQPERILEGEVPSDIFIRWKPLHTRAIGQEPDWGDWVLLDSLTLIFTELRKGGCAGAGILCWKPNIEWGKNRGKEPEELWPHEEFSWFWGFPDGRSMAERKDFKVAADPWFDEQRWNGLHCSPTLKEEVRCTTKIRSEH